MGLKDILGSAANSLANAKGNLTQPKMMYSVPSSVITDIFQPRHLSFRNNPEMHYPMLAMLGQVDRAKGSNYTAQNPDIAKTYLVHPNRKIAREELGYIGADDEINASAAIMYTRFQISRERDGFAVMIRDGMLSGPQHKAARHGCVKLAMGGYFDTSQNFTIEKLMLPAHYIKPNTRSQTLKDTPVHENSIQGALYFAHLCTEQLFERTTFTPDYNFEQSIKSVPDEQRVNVTMAPHKIRAMRPTM